MSSVSIMSEPTKPVNELRTRHTVIKQPLVTKKPLYVTSVVCVPQQRCHHCWRTNEAHVPHVQMINYILWTLFIDLMCRWMVELVIGIVQGQMNRASAHLIEIESVHLVHCHTTCLSSVGPISEWVICISMIEVRAPVCCVVLISVANAQ